MTGRPKRYHSWDVILIMFNFEYDYNYDFRLHNNVPQSRCDKEKTTKPKLTGMTSLSKQPTQNCRHNGHEKNCFYHKNSNNHWKWP